MPLKLPASMTDDVFVIGFDDSNEPGVVLADGQAGELTSEDIKTIIVTQDAVARPTVADANVTAPDGTVVLVPAGTATLASGKVSVNKPPAQPNVPITITWHIHNVDGTPVLDDETPPQAIPNLSDTVTTGPSILRKEGMLFGVAA
jgi:hypothetical protein